MQKTSPPGPKKLHDIMQMSVTGVLKTKRETNKMRKRIAAWLIRTGDQRNWWPNEL